MAPEIEIFSGVHAREHCPVRVPWPRAEFPGALDFGGRITAAQRDGSALAFILPPVPEQTRLTGAAAAAVLPDAVTVSDTGSEIIVQIEGAEFTRYHYAGVPARPYFWPVLGPGSTPVTRAYPMHADVPGEKHDHPHHRSLYIAHGCVNGTDNWSEEKGHGYTRHRSIDAMNGGAVFRRFATTSDWTDPAGVKILSQRLKVTVWKPSEKIRLMDVEVNLQATECDVRFGDTKEGGILSVRVASELDVPRGGRIENSYGGVDEGETWGKAANWCDYSGMVGGVPAGIAVMDHPESFRYPTHWHVRNYGLMTANPFGLSDFTGGVKNGTHVLGQGDSLQFRYRVAIHRASAADAGIRDHYLSFVSPPRAEVV